MAERKAEKDFIGSAGKSVRIIAVLLAIATLLVAFRLADLQIVHSEKYKKSATASQWTEQTLKAIRGTIYDANGSVIARSARTWQLYVVPERFTNEKFREAFCDDLAASLDLDTEDLKEATAAEVTIAQDENVTARRVTVKKQIEYEEKTKIYCGKSNRTEEEVKADNCIYHRTREIDGKTYRYSDVMGLDNDSKRYYPMGEFASSVIGTVNADGNGVAGIEAYYNTLLSGTDGRTTSYGTNLDEDNETVYEASDGVNLVLTLDETIQYALDEQLQSVYKSSGGIGAYGIVMDVKTGAVLAIDAVGYKGGYNLSNPDAVNEYYERKALRYPKNDNFSDLAEYYGVDLDKSEEDMNDEEKEGLEKLDAVRNIDSYEERVSVHEKKLRYFYKLEQWNNYNVSELYHPGSVFKIFLTSAALEEGVVDESYKYSCFGSIAVEDRIFNCHADWHGEQNLREGLMHSCNPYFINLGLKLGAEKFFKYFKAFGFTEKTGFESLEEANPIYYRQDQLTRVSLASESFGQTFSVTPMQIITGISAIANGGYLMRPYIVAEQRDSKGNVISKTEPQVRRQVISKETADLVTSMMEDVCIDGSGKNGYVPGYHVAGKTGTTQKYQVKGTYIASFGCFAPADDPEVAMLIIVDEPQGEYNGSTVCAPVAAKLMETTLEYLGVERQYNETELANLDTTTPGVIGKSPDAAEETLEEAGFSVRVIGDGDKVVSQSPAGGQTIPQGGVVVIYTTDDDDATLTVTVPNLLEMGVSGVKKYAASEGINVKIAGITGSDAVSYEQSVEPGTEVEYGTIVTVSFKSYQNIGDT